ncbi:MAG: hypothetical protein ABIL16_07920 [candidate division WOR-3 bacterium]
MKLLFFVLLFYGCSLKGTKSDNGFHEVPKNALEVFNNYGCKNCHTLPPTDYTDYGREMLKKGYGCISLQTLAKKHALLGDARKVFIENGCSKCHNPDGKGIGDKNLTKFGLEIERKGLGCVETFKQLLGESQ